MTIKLVNIKYPEVRGEIAINFYGDINEVKEIEVSLNNIIRKAIKEFNADTENKFEFIF